MERNLFNIKVTIRVWPKSHGCVDYTEKVVTVLYCPAVVGILKDYADAATGSLDDFSQLYMLFRGTDGVERAARMRRRLENQRVELSDY